MSVLPSFLDLSSCVGWPKTYTQATAKIYWDVFILVSTGSSRATGWERTVRCASRSTVSLRTSKVYLVSCTTFFQKKKPNGHSKNSRTVRKRKIPAGKSDRRAGKGGKRWASFTVFNIVKCTNKVAGRSGCPVSNPDPNNTIGLLTLRLWKKWRELSRKVYS